MDDLRKPPFPYPGKKARPAPKILEALGSVHTYVEPFAGSLAIPLSRPDPYPYEVFNDRDGLLVNFWRAVRDAPGEVAKAAAGPRASIELAARHNEVWRRKDRVQAMIDDPAWCDPETAGLWLYVRCAVVATRGIFDGEMGRRVPKSTPNGIHAQSMREDVAGHLKRLARRLDGAAILCADWTDAVKPTWTIQQRPPVGVVLDPPYQTEDCDSENYEHGGDGDRELFDEVVEWAQSHGDDERFRIIVCGYEDGRDWPDGWSSIAWQAHGGHTVKNPDSERHDNRRERERLWLSPHCQHGDQQTLI